MVAGQPGVCVVSLNPAVDVEWCVPEIVPGEKNELTSERRWPGGKGINVARWLAWSGTRSRLVLPLGGATGRELAVGLRAENLPFRAVPILQSSRANVVVTPKTGTQLRFNPSWPVLSPAEVGRLLRSVEMAWRGCEVVVLSGSLVRGASPDTYFQLTRKAKAAGLKVFLDCDGEPFRRAIRAQPFLVKPNDWELEQWAGRKLSSERALRMAARELSEQTGGWVLVSRGAAGAVLVHAGTGAEWSAPARQVTVRNTVGAGDALLAAVVASVQRGEAPTAWLRHGLAAGAAAVRLSPGHVPRRRTA
jgi:1-phosphofructokinase family hexose kinase